MPDINDEVKAAEDKLKSINDQVAVVANMQVQLGDDVQKLNIEIQGLQAKKDGLLTAIDNLEANIKQKESERNESLNERDTVITDRERHIEHLQEELQTDIDNLDVKEKDLQLRLEVIRADEQLNADKKAANDKKEIELNIKEATLNAQIAENISRAGIQEETIKNANDAMAEYKIKGSKAENQIIENGKIEEKLTALLDSAQQKESDLNKKLADFEPRKKSLNELEALIDSKRIENDHLHEGQLEVIREENKKIQLAWLQINKKIQDHQIDIDIEALKK